MAQIFKKNQNENYQKFFKKPELEVQEQHTVTDIEYDHTTAQRDSYYQSSGLELAQNINSTV